MTNVKDLKIGFSWEPKKEEIKPIGKVIRFKSNLRVGKLLTGYCVGINDLGQYVVYYAATDLEAPIIVRKERIVEAYEVVKHEPQENISVAQETATFGYQAVQGIVAAHMDKENPSKVPPFKLNPIYTGKDMKKYGEEQYMRGREDEHRENPQGLKTVEEYKKYGRDCYLQGQTDEINRGTSFTFSDFDSSVARTWKKQDFKDAVSNAALGLTGEAGEVADLIKKAVYHGRGFSDLELKFSKPVRETDVKDELSDVLFYVSALAQEFGFT